VPYPIQSGSITDRLRKFFRIRGRTGFQLDEMVAPVVIVQDLTKGPYQSGVTPAAGERLLVVGGAGQPDAFTFAVLLNDKPGSLTPVLDTQFIGRSFSFSFVEISNISIAAPDVQDLALRLAKRADVVAAGVPTSASNLTSIQENDGTDNVPVEIFGFNDVEIPGVNLWRGFLGDNTNTPGAIKTLDDIQPNITIGPEDALIFTNTASGTAGLGGSIGSAYRGFYQEQPS